MDREADQMKIKQLLTATIASLCSNSLSYSGELTIQGLLGITIDHKDILLVNINETLAHARSTSVQHGETVAEPTQSGTLLQPTGIEQNYVTDNVVAVKQKQAVNTGKSTASKNRGQRTRTAVVDYAPAYPSSLQNIKTEPGLHQTAAPQVKMEPSADYAGGGGYYAGDEESIYDNYDMFYNQPCAMYTDPGGSFSNTGQYVDDASQVMEYSRPRSNKVQKVCTAPVKKTAVAAKSVNRAATQAPPSGKDVNSSLIQRALDLVHEGQLTAGVAIKLFGIPRSTFYKKLSMCNQPQQQPASGADTEAEQYYQADDDFQTDFGSCSGDIVDSFVGAGDNTDTGMSGGQWSNYVDYYTT